VNKNKLSSEDSALFRKSIGKVNKLETKTISFSSKDKPKPKPYPTKQTTNNINDFENSINSQIEKLTQEDSFSFLAPGLQNNILKKLRKGYFGTDASIDLHGLTSQEANHQLSKFLHFSIEDGYRCIHIIHGKGYGSSKDHPVLKNDVNLWLRQHKDVQAFCSTLPKDGGAGAVFVLLKLSEKYKSEEDT
jgi:DNA-nicking Smr family endonuclease